jgi:hypothetical protein
MGRINSKKLETVKLKGRQQNGIEKETKQDQRLKKKEIRKQLNRAKDYGTSEEKDFSLALLAIRLKIKYMDGDGNCLFRSIADQLTGECSNVNKLPTHSTQICCNLLSNAVLVIDIT